MNRQFVTYNKGSAVFLLRKFLGIILYISIACEMLFFPSLDNFAGCLMTLIVWAIFRTFFLKRKIIVAHPFAFLILLTCFLARYIPLVATLLEGKPISIGFEIPLETFFWETIMFGIISLAFYVAIVYKSKRNNLIQRTLFKLKFFEADAVTLWLLGFLGLGVRIQQLAVSGQVEFGDAGNKFLAGLEYLQYAPILMLFPKLAVGISQNSKRRLSIWLYITSLFVISLATNSRQDLIYPIATYILLFFLSTLKENVSVFSIISPWKMLVVGVLVIWGTGFLSDISLAMLANRSIRNDIGRMELFEKTTETLLDEQQMSELRSNLLEKQTDVVSYGRGWNETYLDNFMLNRYGNLRVSDQTIYHSMRVGMGNEEIQASFWAKVLATFPTPMSSAIGLDVNKANLQYSPGDLLYFVSTRTSNVLGGFRVTSLIADGLATFGYWSLPIIFLLFVIVFRLLDCLVLRVGNVVVYSTLGLVSVFYFFGMFRNSIGMINLVGFVIRGFWQLCVTYYAVYFFSRTISRLFFKRSS